MNQRTIFSLPGALGLLCSAALISCASSADLDRVGPANSSGGSSFGGEGGADPSTGGTGTGGTGTGGTDPGTGGTDPGTGGTDPGTGGTDPGAGGTDPGTGGADPGTGGTGTGGTGTGGTGTGGTSGDGVYWDSFVVTCNGSPVALTNGGFDTGNGSGWWFADGMAVVTDAHDGTHAAKAAVPNAGFSQIISSVSSGSCTVEFWAQASAGTYADGGLCDDGSCGTNRTTPVIATGTGWQQYSATRSVPAGGKLVVAGWRVN
jgi:hypothetical protein